MDCTLFNDFYNKKQIAKVISNFYESIKSGKLKDMLLNLGFVEYWINLNGNFLSFYNCQREDFDIYNDFYVKYAGKDFNGPVYYKIMSNYAYNLLEDVYLGKRKASKAVYDGLKQVVKESLVEFEINFLNKTNNSHFKTIKETLISKIPKESEITYATNCTKCTPGKLVNLNWVINNLKELVNL